MWRTKIKYFYLFVKKEIKSYKKFIDLFPSLNITKRVSEQDVYRFFPMAMNFPAKMHVVKYLERILYLVYFSMSANSFLTGLLCANCSAVAGKTFTVGIALF